MLFRSSGSIVIAKIPEAPLKWMNEDSDEKIGKLRNCCVWLDNFNDFQKAIASVIRSWITDQVPSTLLDEMENIKDLYTFETTQKEFLDYLNGMINNRLNEMKQLVKVIEKKSESKE